MNKYHLRVTVDRTNACIIAGSFIAKFNPKRFIFGFEKKGENEHFHGHIEYEKLPTKQQMSEFFAPIKKKIAPKSKCPIYWHKQLQKEEDHNISYVTKEDDIILHNFTELELEEIKENNQLIEDEKKTPMKD